MAAPFTPNKDREMLNRVFWAVVILGLLCAVACDLNTDSDNYVKVYTPDAEPYQWPATGDWGEFVIDTQNNEVRCEEGKANITFFGQKYFSLDVEICGLGTVVAYICYPPYDRLCVWVDGGRKCLRRR